jgi:hypothetical protein
MLDHRETLSPVSEMNDSPCGHWLPIDAAAPVVGQPLSPGQLALLDRHLGLRATRDAEVCAPTIGTEADLQRRDPTSVPAEVYRL